MKKIIYLLLITSLVLFISTSKLDAATTTAKTLGDLYDYLEYLKQQKIERENNIALSEAEYQKVSNEITESQKKVAKLNEEIEQTEGEIRNLEKEIEEKKEETDKILVFLEVSSGESSYLEYIFKATSFTDFIHRVSIVEEISKYNKDLIKEMNDLIKQNEQKKKSLAESVKKEEIERKNLEANLQKIGDRITNLYSEGSTLEEDIEAQEFIIAYYEGKGCNGRDDVLSVCSKMPPIPLATGFIRPLYKGIVTSDYGFRISPIYGWGEGHSGVDIGGNSVGTPVYPVAAGTVGFETNWNCGGKVLGVYHIIKGVKYTSIYMHLQGFNVEVGDIVYTDDVIGFVGGIYDSCSTGAHLHLSMAYGHLTSPGAYRNYIFDPTEVIYFGPSWFYQRTWA